MGIKVRYCPHGHDKEVVGVTRAHRCAECHRRQRLNGTRRDQDWKGTDSSQAVYIKNLTKIREEIGLTIKEFAAISGCHVSTLYRIENGERRAGRDLQMKILKGVHRSRKIKRERMVKDSGYYLNLAEVTK